jgi:hypothetical protein
MGKDKEAVALGVEVRVELVKHARGGEFNFPLRHIVARTEVGDEDFEGVAVRGVNNGKVLTCGKLGGGYIIHRLGVEGGRTLPPP